MNSKKDKKKAGFTMMEMLIVVAIIGAIAIIIAVSYKNVLPHVSNTTATVMEGKLNNAANEWIALKVHSGEMRTKSTDLGSTLEEAITVLKAPITIDGTDINVGLPEGLAIKKLEGLGITYSNGQFIAEK